MLLFPDSDPFIHGELVVWVPLHADVNKNALINGMFNGLYDLLYGMNFFSWPYARMVPATVIHKKSKQNRG